MILYSRYRFPGVLTGVALAAAVLAAAPAARADKAIVVGVNKYPSLRINQLRGCVNDALAMAAALKRYNFEVVGLTDERATRKGILDALAMAGRAMRPGERFVFFFAGHGTIGSDGRSVLLPHDSRENSEANDISAVELNQAILKVPAKSRTVLLDACFSGGMARSAKGVRTRRPAVVSRSYERLSRAGKDPDLRASGNDTNNAVAGQSGVCYFTASRHNEQSHEDDFGGVRHGVFTQFLTQRLTGERTFWEDIRKIVYDRVATHMEDMQHPVLAGGFEVVRIFEAKDAPRPTPVTPDPVTPPPAPKRSTIWEVYSKEHPDPARLQLTIAPDKTMRQVNEELSFAVRAGVGGYLVLLERGVSGKLNLLFPRTRSADEARVTAGRTIRIPEEGQAFYPDRPGNEAVKALLFQSREEVAALLAAFPASLSIESWQNSKDLVIGPVRPRPPTPAPIPVSAVITSALTFEVVP